MRGLRQVGIASSTGQENRRLASLRRDAGRARTRVVNEVRQIIRRHNLQWQMPTKRFPTLGTIAWLKTLALPSIDRLEMDHLLADLKQVQKWVADLEKVIAERCGNSEDAELLATIPGVASFTATSLACRVGGIESFPRSNSLANYLGLTRGCRNSGEHNHRLGHITKAGSSMARWLLAQMAHKVLRQDARLREWYKRIKRRRGASMVRVAVIRKLATITWHMLSKRLSFTKCRQLAIENQT